MLQLVCIGLLGTHCVTVGLQRFIGYALCYSWSAEVYWVRIVLQLVCRGLFGTYCVRVDLLVLIGYALCYSWSADA